MWPAKENLGPQLTYGVLGNGLATRDSLPSHLGPFLKFPRLRDRGPHLHLIEHSSRTLAPGIPPEDIDTKLSVYSTHHRHPNDVDVPEDVAASLAIEARPLRDGIALDPTTGKLAIIFELRTDRLSDMAYCYDALNLLDFTKSSSTLQATAFITGSGKLKVMPLLVKKRNIFDTESMEKLKKLPIDYVCEKHGFELQISWPVKHIVASADGKLLAVRGHGECCIFSVKWDLEKNRINVRKEFNIKNTGSEWSEVVFNTSSLAFVNTRGVITMYKFQRTKKGYQHELLSEIDPSIYAPLDWSSWKRVCWPLDANYIILFSRKSAHYIEMNTDDMGKRVVKKLVTTHYWSHFQDVAIVNSNIFLFTSKELIWLLTTLEAPFKRILSWKHYLDDSDASLKLSVCSNKSGTYTLSVYSHETPIIIAYTFGTVDGRPCSVLDPFVLYMSDSSGVAHLSVAESLIEADDLSPLANCIEISCDAEVKFLNLCTSKNKKVRTDDSMHKNITSKPFKPLRIFSARELDLVYKYFLDPNSTEENCDFEKDTLEIAVKPASGASESSGFSQKMITASDGVEDTTIADLQIMSTDSNTNSKLEFRQQIDVVQNYAFELGSELKTFFNKENTHDQEPQEEDTNEQKNADLEITGTLYPQYHTLASLAENIPTDVTNLKEFDSMLHQLNEYCEDQGGRLEFGNSTLMKGSLDSSVSSEFIHDNILKLEDPARAKVAVILALCMIRAHCTNIAKRHKELITKELEGCSEDLKDIFGEWPAHEPESFRSQTQNGAQSQPQVQTQNSKGKKGLLHRALTQSSQAFQVTSTPRVGSNGSSKQESSLKIKTSQSSQEQSQESDTLFISQFQSTQESLGSEPFSSQVGGSQSLKRSSQLGPRRKKKKKGGFA